MLLLRIILLISFLCGVAHAEFLASVSYFQYSLSEQQTGESQQQTLLTSYSTNLQYLMGSRYLVGINYMVESGSSAIQKKRETVLPNVGFFYGKLWIEGGPVSKSIDKLNIAEAGEWRDGTGYYTSLTFYDSWANWVLIGFQFTFLDIEYRKYFDGVNESSIQSRKVSVLSPSLRLSFLF